MKETVEPKTQKWNKHKNPVEDSKEKLKDVKPIRAITVEKFSKRKIIWKCSK